MKTSAKNKEKVIGLGNKSRGQGKEKKYIQFILTNPYLWIVLLGCIVYCKTPLFGYTGVDEFQLIDLNTKDSFAALFLKGIFANFREANRQIGGDYYRPVLSLSFKIESLLPGDKHMLAHSGNIFYHLLACCLLFAFLIKLEIDRQAALLFSLLFTVHPVLTQAVAWIPGRNDSLLAIFTLCSILFFLDFEKTKKWLFYLLHHIFFLCALLTKETGIAIPLVVVALHLLWLKKPLFSKSLLIQIPGWILPVVFWYLLRKAAIGSKIDVLPSEMLTSLLTRIPVLVQYIGKIIFPLNLSVYPTIKDTTMLWGLISIVLIVSAVLFTREKDWRKILLALLWFFIFLLPVLMLPERINANLFEHRLYLPIIGIFLLLNETFLLKAPVGTSKIFIRSGGLLIALFSFVSFVHSNDFADQFNYWKNAAETSPNSAGAQYVFGVQCYSHKDSLAAEEYIKKALELNPKETKANYVLGTLYKEEKRFPEAIKYLSIETTLDPQSDSTAFSLAYSLYSVGRVKEAEAWYLKTLELNNNYLDAYQSLAIIYDQQFQRYDMALYYANEMQKRGGYVPKDFFDKMNRLTSPK